jgi:hypothetical protein
VAPEPLLLIQPVAGEPNVDIFYGAYVDVHNTGSVGDYQCGAKTFNAHTGTDILIRNFEVMDSGVTVLAAAPGVVATARDGQFDRNTAFAPASAGNHVTIEHENNYSTLYAHLKNGSVQVQPGETVSAGTPIGQIGSSGSSNWHHLHFEVRANGKPVEPANGPCNGLSLWANQLPYQNAFMVTDAGLLTGTAFSLAALLEAPATRDTVGLNSDSLLFWLQTLNHKSETMRFELIDPSDSITFQISGSENASFALRYLGLPFQVPDGPAGAWQIRMLINGVVHRQQTFELVVPPSTRQPAGWPSGTRFAPSTDSANR